MKQASMGDVATEAQVATSTVSRFLAGNLRVADDTEARIIEAIERLGYDRSVSGKPASIKSRPTLVAIVVSDLGNSYYAAFAESAAREMESVGFSVVTLSIRHTAMEPLSGIEALLQAGLAGVISIGGTRTSELRKRLKQRDVPLVTVEESHEQGATTSVDIDLDNYSGARQAVTYLTRLGHKRIAFISGPRDLAPVKARRRGYEDGLAAEGIVVADQFDLEGECSEDFGFAALTKLLSFPGARPTAVFVAADEIAVGVMNAASQMMLNVPKELSIVGFDDISAASHVTPRLTTVHTPVGRLAEVASTALLEVLSGQGQASGTSTVVPVSLVVRDSSCSPETL